MLRIRQAVFAVLDEARVIREGEQRVRAVDAARRVRLSHGILPPCRSADSTHLRRRQDGAEHLLIMTRDLIPEHAAAERAHLFLHPPRRRQSIS